MDLKEVFEWNPFQFPKQFTEEKKILRSNRFTPDVKYSGIILINPLFHRKTKNKSM